MTEYLLNYGFSADLVHYLLVPLLIIGARILDVSISTIRLLLVIAPQIFRASHDVSSVLLFV